MIIFLCNLLNKSAMAVKHPNWLTKQEQKKKVSNIYTVVNWANILLQVRDYKNEWLRISKNAQITPIYQGMKQANKQSLEDKQWEPSEKTSNDCQQKDKQANKVKKTRNNCQ